MITKTSLHSVAYLLRVKSAIARAIRKAHKNIKLHGVGHADVYSMKGRYSLQIVARVGGRWEAFDSEDRDVTATVMEALRAYHDDMHKPARPSSKGFSCANAAAELYMVLTSRFSSAELYAPAAKFMSVRP